MRSKTQCFVLFVLALGCCVPASGQDANTRNMYGKGVHAYYRGDISSARQHLEQSVAYGSKDPRTYYFLGLTKLRSGDTYGAESDFNVAATLEYSSKGSYDVGMSLSRIQGGARQTLERVRRDTRAAIRSQPATRRDMTPPSIAPDPTDVGPSGPSYNEFEHAPMRNETTAPASDLPAGPVDADDPGDPFMDDEAGGDNLFDESGSSAGSTAAGGGQIVGSMMRALFNAGSKAVPSANIDLPFPAGGPPAAAAADGGFGAEGGDDFGFGDEGDMDAAPAGEEMGEGELDDLFGDDEAPMEDAPISDPPADPADDGGLDDLFGDEPAASDPAVEEPADDMGDDGLDPFGDEPAEDPPAPADDMGDDGGLDDLFGDDGGEPADDDPFGGDDLGGDGGGSDDDPFGDGGGEPSADDDPFGDAGDGGGEGDDDPFGF